MEHRQGAPRRRAASPAPPSSRSRSPRARRASGSASCPRARRSRARARRSPIGGKIVGKVTTGGFAPTLGRAVAMGYVERSASRPTARRSSSSCAASPCRPRSCRCRSSSTPTTADRRLRWPSVKYSKEHEWIRVEGDVGTVGITDYAQEQLGDVVFVELPAGRPQGRQGRGGRRRRIGQGRERHLRAGRPARSSRSTPRSPTTPGDVNADADGQGLVLQDQARRQGELDGPDGRGRLRRAFVEEPRAEDQRDALSAAHRCRPPRDAGAIGARSVDELFRDVPASARLGAKIAGLPDHQGELEVERAFQAYAAKNVSPAVGAVLPRRRRLSPSRAGDRRLPDPARRVPDLLHALPARGHAGHAAVSVRVPDPGRRCSPAWRWPTPRCTTARPAPPRPC